MISESQNVSDGWDFPMSHRGDALSAVARAALAATCGACKTSNAASGSAPLRAEEAEA